MIKLKFRILICYCNVRVILQKIEWRMYHGMAKLCLGLESMDIARNTRCSGLCNVGESLISVSLSFVMKSR